MGYYVRAFCTAPEPPTVRTVLDALASWGVVLVPEPDCARPEVLECADWNGVRLLYKVGKLPIVVECNRHNGTPHCLAAAEVREFLELIGPPGRSKAKQRVIEHLKATCFVMASQLPSSDIDDDGFAANDEFMTYFEDMCGGMVQADGEGFYDNNKLLVTVK